MKAKLVSIAGPLRGGVFTLPASGDFASGRSVANHLCLEDPSVSRRHCVLARDGQQFKITDRGSVNRTYINGLPLAEHLLRNGDEIKIGESLFLFVDEELDEQQRVDQVRASEETIHLSDTLSLRAAELLGLEQLSQVRPARSGGLDRYTETLLAISEAASAPGGVEALERRILELLSRAVAADFGAIMLAENGESFGPACEWQRDPTERFQLPPSLVERAVRERAPVWSSEAGAGEAGAVAVKAGTATFVGVPLVAFMRFVGLLCLGRSSARSAFEPEHLKFLRSTSGLIAALLDHAVSTQDQEDCARQRQAEINLEHNMVGESAPMRRVYEIISRVAPTDSTVLIFGESGTGKELAARAIHRNSPRARKPFVAINCAALTETLLESELFGHERGAFTGAVALKKGKLEEAAGGSVFLDEIGEMSPVLQAKLLRVLQEREFERVGGTHTIKADIRVIAATNRNLEEAIRRGTFRTDLFYRLNVVTLTMPPLRDRREDIPLLANYFAQKHSRNLKRWISGISEAAHACLRSYDWPGNVRELENVVERALVLGSTDTIQPEDLPESVIDAGHVAETSATGFHTNVKEMKKQLILETLEKTGGNYTEAARILDLHPNSLHRIVRNLKIKTRTAN